MWSSLCGRMSSLLWGKYLAGLGGGVLFSHMVRIVKLLFRAAAPFLRFRQQCKRASVVPHLQLLVLPGL